MKGKYLRRITLKKASKEKGKFLLSREIGNIFFEKSGCCKQVLLDSF